MEPFDSIGKLISEHGSAEILRQQLSFAAQQYAALEREVAKLKSENSTLKAENLKLDTELHSAREEIQTLKKLPKRTIVPPMQPQRPNTSTL
jgi:regulator of replication initiation timing